MAIDNPLDALDQQNKKDKPTLPSKVAKVVASYGLRGAFPMGGLAVDILLKAIDTMFNEESAAARADEFFGIVKAEFEHVEETKASHADVQKAIQLGFLYDRVERDDAKRDRYVKLIGSALRSKEQVEDVASYVQTIEQLNERDVVVLKVLNKVMNQSGDWKPQHDSVQGQIMKLHPNVFLQRAQELSTQIALALGQATERNTFSREVGYGICNRLQGFGLAHEIELQPRELPLANYCFRLSVQGLQLLKLLGEDTPNYERCTPTGGEPYNRSW